VTWRPGEPLLFSTLPCLRVSLSPTPMLYILDPGFFTTIQDLGRSGFQKYGVSVGGAMDELALRAANRLVGNAEDEAALEITIAGPRLGVLERCLVAVAGARFALTINERAVPTNTALFLRAGEALEFGARETDARAYLALAGGIDVPRVLNSRSTDVRGGLGGFDGRALRAGDVIAPRARAFPIERAGRRLPSAFEAYYASRAPVRVIEGPHAEFFTGARLEGEYVVSELSDRMALRLRGNQIPRVEGELLSCGVTLGAIQVPPDGQPIVLMADHQTAGGYPILATVIRADIPRLAQKTAGDRLAFRAVTLEEARQARVQIEQLLLL
jgi:biotin-dependent carboxylase-like uncharacterized protein